LSDLSALARLLLVLTVFEFGCASAPSPSPAATDPVAIEQATEVRVATAPVVHVESDLTRVAQVGGEIILELSVSNVGPRDIQDLTIIVNDAFLAKMAAVATNPNAIRHNEQGGEYFTFGTLAKGSMERYVIRMSPNEAGAFSANVDVAEWSSSDMLPLAEADGGVAEYTYETQVVAP